MIKVQIPDSITKIFSDLKINDDNFIKSKKFHIDYIDVPNNIKIFEYINCKKYEELTDQKKFYFGCRIEEISLLENKIVVRQEQIYEYVMKFLTT